MCPIYQLYVPNYISEFISIKLNVYHQNDQISINVKVLTCIALFFAYFLNNNLTFRFKNISLCPYEWMDFVSFSTFLIHGVSKLCHSWILAAYQVA